MASHMRTPAKIIGLFYTQKSKTTTKAIHSCFQLLKVFKHLCCYIYIYIYKPSSAAIQNSLTSLLRSLYIITHPSVIKTYSLVQIYLNINLYQVLRFSSEFCSVRNFTPRGGGGGVWKKHLPSQTKVCSPNLSIKNMQMYHRGQVGSFPT